MPYTIDRLLTGVSFEDADARTRAALQAKGFGVLTEIDVKATMKKKLDKDMPSYRILGACNPGMAFAAIGMEPRVAMPMPPHAVQSSANPRVSGIVRRRLEVILQSRSLAAA